VSIEALFPSWSSRLCDCNECIYCDLEVRPTVAGKGIEPAELVLPTPFRSRISTKRGTRRPPCGKVAQ
jgi:hypothetical protein